MSETGFLWLLIRFAASFDICSVWIVMKGGTLVSENSNILL